MLSAIDIQENNSVHIGDQLDPYDAMHHHAT